MLCCVFWCRGGRKSKWGRWGARGERQVGQPIRMRHVQHQMTDSFQAHKDEVQSVMAWALSALEPSAWCAFRACEQTVLHRCVLWVGVLFTEHVDFLEFFPGNRNQHHFSDDVVCHEFKLVCLRRIPDLVGDVAYVLDVSVTEIAAFPPGEHLGFWGIALFSV